MGALFGWRPNWHFFTLSIDYHTVVRSWEWLHRAASVIQVWQAAITLLALMVAAWGWLKALPGPTLVAIFVSTAAAGIWLVNGIIWGLTRAKMESSGVLPGTSTVVDANRTILREIYRKSAEPAGREAMMLADHLTSELRRKGSLHAEIARLFDYLLRHYATVRNAMLERFDIDGPTQEAFAAFYRAYQDVVDEIRQVGAATGYQFSVDGNYALWKRHDITFMKDLHELIAKEDFHPLRIGVSNYKWPEGARQYWA